MLVGCAGVLGGVAAWVASGESRRIGGDGDTGIVDFAAVAKYEV